MKKIGKKLIVASITIMYIMCTLLSAFNNIFAYEISEYKNGIDAFPDSYKVALNELKKKHPNWEFVAVYTNLDFDFVVSQEMVEGRSLISKTAFSDEWKRDNIDVEPGWVNASEMAVRYFLDPRNFLTEEKIFQFELSNFNETSHTSQVVEGILAGCNLSNASYYINNKKKIDMGQTYAQIICQVAKETNINAVHLASRIVQETGGTIGSIDANGNVVLDKNGNVGYYTASGVVKTANRTLNGSYKSDIYGDFSGCYNFFNIGAFCSKNCGFCGNPFVHGLQRAKTNGWNTPKTAILAASKSLMDNWVKYGQNTVYFEKFDVNFVPGAKFLFGNQYMTNISAASTESTLMYKGYSSNKDILNGKFVFHIPVYDNMDGKINTEEKRVQVINSEKDGLNIMESKDSSSKVIKNVANGTVMTQIADDGSGWIKVRIDEKIEGYVRKEYITYNVNIQVEKIEFSKKDYVIKKGNSLSLTPIITPNDATDKTYTIKSDDENIVRVDGKNLIGLEIGKTSVTFTTTNGKSVQITVEVEKQPEEKFIIDTNKLNVNKTDNTISVSQSVKLADVKSSIKLAQNVSIVAKNVNGIILSDDSIVGTATLISIIENGNILAEYNIVVKGDVNGDGKITASDYVFVKNNIMGTSSLNNIQRLGADVNGDGKITSSDYVIIKNNIMGRG